MATDWLLVATAALVVLHLAVVAYAFWRTRPGGRESATANAPGPVEGSHGDPRSEDGVLCPTCGVTNEPDYRYCRQCVSELPTGVSFVKGSTAGQSRRTL